MARESDDCLPEPNDDTTSTAVLTPVHDGPHCEKCGTPAKSDLVTVCRKCGWYPSLNQFVEVDHEYEACHEGQPTGKPKRSHLQVWASLLPPWSWVLIVTVAAIVIESVVARYFTDETTRMHWSLTQLAIGAVAFLGCHVFNFLVSATEDADIGFLDVFIRPFSLWLRAIRNLPRRLLVADGALGGATAVLMSVLVIGALPYDALWNWGGKPKKVNLLASMVKQAQNLPVQNGGGSLAEAVGGIPENKGGGADNLEDAIGDLAGQELPSDGAQNGGAAGGNGADSSESGADADADAEKKDAAKPKYEKTPGVRPKIACVILGYRLDGRGQISSLILGAMHDDKLAYAGVVTAPAEDASLIDITDDLERSKIAHPVIPVYLQANWVMPKFVCQVNYHEREADGRLIDVQWEKLRGTLANSSFKRSEAPYARQQ